MKQLSRFIGLFAICFFVSFGSAQTPTGTIEGVVTDKSGATIAGASISIIQTSTNKTRVTSTDSAGRFVVPFIDPGIYTVTVDANGFNRGVEKNVLVQVTQSSTVNFKLQVGKVTETVQVNASAASLDEGTTSMGQTVQSSTFLELPDNGRNPFDFALLVPGVQDGPGNSEGASTPHIGGSRNANNEEQIDGMTNILPENNVGNSLAAYQPIDDEPRHQKRHEQISRQLLRVHPEWRVGRSTLRVAWSAKY
jgi:predicted secreted protein